LDPDIRRIAEYVKEKSKTSKKELGPIHWWDSLIQQTKIYKTLHRN
jgi:hypothetical protein